MYQRFVQHPNTRCHAGLSDEQLLALYQSADIGVMPVIDCTANNGLLEMMATGLPVVMTDIGATYHPAVLHALSEVVGATSSIKSIDRQYPEFSGR